MKKLSTTFKSIVRLYHRFNPWQYYAALAAKTIDLCVSIFLIKYKKVDEGYV